MIIDAATLRRWSTQGPYREEREEMERWARREELMDLAEDARARKRYRELKRKDARHGIYALIYCALLGFAFINEYDITGFSWSPSKQEVDNAKSYLVSKEISKQIDNPIQGFLP
jgi:hypothetical protein